MLSSCPPELLRLITEFLDPSAITSFRATCRAFAESSTSTFEEHKRRLADERIAHDCHPSTLPDLLRKIEANDPSLWYTQHIEAWVIRPSWQFWWHPAQISSFRQYSWPESPLVTDRSEFDREFSCPSELHRFKIMLRDRLKLSNKQAQKYIKRIRAGDDGPIRVAVYALLPHLRELILGQYPHDWMYSDRPLGRSPLGPLNRIIEVSDRTGHWPAGIRSLRILETRRCGNRRYAQDQYFLKPREYIPLLKLPNLQQLHLEFVDRYDHGQDIMASWPLSERSSSIRQLYMGDIGSTVLERKILESIRTVEQYHGSGNMSLLGEHRSTIKSYSGFMDIQTCQPYQNLRHINFVPSSLLSSTVPLDYNDDPEIALDVDALTFNLPSSIECITIFPEPRISRHHNNELSMTKLRHATIQSLQNLVRQRWQDSSNDVKRHICLRICEKDKYFNESVRVIQSDWRQPLLNSPLVEQCKEAGVALHFGDSTDCSYRGVHKQWDWREWLVSERNRYTRELETWSSDDDD